ncbi:MAG: helix-turn-helix domain-containing protein [Bifidobacteriaceae bacterium]|nr:helix-turn-helix domain-containing protein [Bifidobacteriaceae bacterium]
MAAPNVTSAGGATEKTVKTDDAAAPATLSASRELVVEIQELREQGLSLRAIARQVGVSHPSVHRLLAFE